MSKWVATSPPASSCLAPTHALKFIQPMPCNSFDPCPSAGDLGDDDFEEGWEEFEEDVGPEVSTGNLDWWVGGGWRGLWSPGRGLWGCVARGGPQGFVARDGAFWGGGRV